MGTEGLRTPLSLIYWYHIGVLGVRRHCDVIIVTAMNAAAVFDVAIVLCMLQTGWNSSSDLLMDGLRTPLYRIYWYHVGALVVSYQSGVVEGHV